MTNSNTESNNTQGCVNTKTFSVIQSSDLIWCSTQKPCVQTLALLCWGIDPFGDRWVELNIELPESTFRRARKVLSDAGLFEFKAIHNKLGSRKIVGWLVRNLHGKSRKRKLNLSKRKKKYYEFLKSEYWQQTRELVLTRDNYTCVKCGNVSNLQVHHLTYKNHGNEQNHLEDLVTLCKCCHTLVHLH